MVEPVDIIVYLKYMDKINKKNLKFKYITQPTPLRKVSKMLAAFAL